MCALLITVAPQIQIMNARFLVLCGALLLGVSGAYGDGAYQSVHRGKGLVWNNNPSAGEVATWRGDRDEEGYATGYGTITWYRLERKEIITGTKIPPVRYVRVSRYSGKMVRGKLDGVVLSVDTGGGTFHATFVKGRKTSAWAAGPPPETSAPAAAPEEPAQLASGNGTAVDQPRDVPVRRAELVEAVAVQPALVPEQIAKPPVSKPAEKKPASDYDDSLRALLGPPPSIRTKDAAETATQASKVPAPAKASPSPARPGLTNEEVISLADAEARTEGYNLDDYQRPQTRYSAENGTWSISYDHNAIDANGESGKPLSVTVEDKTKKTSVVPGR
jgi:hypothetical protein